MASMEGGAPAELADVMTRSLHALLTDLQNTTEVLKRASRPEKPMPTTTVVDGEPIYEPQQSLASRQARPPSEAGLEDLEQLLDDYSQRRSSSKQQHSRPTVESLLTQLDDDDGGAPADMSNGRAPAYDRYSSRRQASIRPSFSSSVRSPAAKDLDELMGSLAGHGHKTQEPPKGAPQYAYTQKATTPTHSAPVAPPRQKVPQAEDTRLDSMLGSLESDMSKLGISTIPKGDCAGCQKTIVGQVVIALGKMWHPEHFLCSHCGEELGHRNFFERSAKAYCENDYHNLFSPRCAYCNGPIKDKCLTALGKTWHADHFLCAKCGREFGDDGFHEKDGAAYCRQDYFGMFAPRCRGCKRPINNNYITALSTQWHPECFVCQDCRHPFDGGSFFDHDGAPYCETHYHEKRGSLCAACERPISGRCVSAMGRKFHPEHFVCSFCRHQLNKGTFKEHERKAYCHKCFGKLLN